MKRIWHPFDQWEEVAAGMWSPATDRPAQLAKAIEFTGDAELYGAAMLRVVVEWPISCEHNLSDVGQNRRAWVGHAAATLATGCPEDVTREAWGHLTQEQRDAANAKADEAILTWERGRADGQLEMFAR